MTTQSISRLIFIKVTNNILNAPRGLVAQESTLPLPQKKQTAHKEGRPSTYTANIHEKNDNPKSGLPYLRVSYEQLKSRLHHVHTDLITAATTSNHNRILRARLITRDSILFTLNGNRVTHIK